MSRGAVIAPSMGRYADSQDRLRREPIIDLASPSCTPDMSRGHRGLKHLRAQRGGVKATQIPEQVDGVLK